MSLAKLQIRNREYFFQSLEGHSVDSLRILREFFSRNGVVIDGFCSRWNLDGNQFRRNLFLTVFLHDAGKLTAEFQSRISEGRHSQKFPHAFFAVPVFMELYRSGLLTPLLEGDVFIELSAVLGHHTQLYRSLYEDVDSSVTYLDDEICGFVSSASSVYWDLGFDAFFRLGEFSFEGFNHLDRMRIQKIIKNRCLKCDGFPGKVRLKAVYSFFFSVLQTCDDYSSAFFSGYVEGFEGGPGVFDSVLEDAGVFVPSLPDSDTELILGGNTPYEYQKILYETSPKYGLLFAPCGRGKTEASLLWALEVCRKFNRNKIVYAMPTQVTSNALVDRFTDIFGVVNVGLFHGKSFVRLQYEKKTSLDLDELSGEDLDVIRDIDFKGNVFFKPVTVTTIDHLIYSFVHGFRQADFALGNLQNAVVVFDEIHYYEKHTLDHLYTLFGILKDMGIPHLLMSGTLPGFLTDSVRVINPEYELVSDLEGLSFTPFRINKVDEPLISGGVVNPDIVDEIVVNYGNNLRQYVILNTVARAQAFYAKLKAVLGDVNIILYHSQYTFKDRNHKEREIIARKEERPFILVATQVIEISLDISCDRMYTELAPADALGQRGGRLNRKGRTHCNGMEYVMNVHLPEEFFIDKPKKTPYDPGLLEMTGDVLCDKVYNYLDLKNLCDRVYAVYGLEKTVLEKRFNECCLFGWSPGDMTFGCEDEGRLLSIRDESFQKIDVIPETYYTGDERELVALNQVKVPLWWLKADEIENGELRFFYMAQKKIGRKEKTYWICRIPYDSEIGFGYDLRDGFVSSAKIM